jgi:hypothetical protein
MKKCAFVILVAVHTSLAAAAKHGTENPQQKEPEKKTEQRTQKVLSKGYFNIFELLLITTEPKDTTEKAVSPPAKTSN